MHLVEPARRRLGGAREAQGAACCASASVQKVKEGTAHVLHAGLGREEAPSRGPRRHQTDPHSVGVPEQRPARQVFGRCVEASE